MININKYCVTFLGTTKNVKNLIKSISEDKVNFLDAKGVVIATFESSMTLKEIETLFTDEDKNFILSKISEDSFGVNMLNKKHQGILFNNITETTKERVNNAFKSFFNVLEDEKQTIKNMGDINKKIKGINNELNSLKNKEEDLSIMSNSELTKLMDAILDKESITDKEKETLKKIGEILK